jgi:hypothetical protein
MINNNRKKLASFFLTTFGTGKVFCESVGVVLEESMFLAFDSVDGKVAFPSFSLFHSEKDSPFAKIERPAKFQLYLLP